MMLAEQKLPGDPAQQDVACYGDGVKDVAFTVRDAAAAYRQALANGGESAYEPVELTDDDGKGTVTMAGIKTYGRCVHSFVSRRGDYDLDKLAKGPRLSNVQCERCPGCPVGAFARSQHRSHSFRYRSSRRRERHRIRQ